MPVRMIDQIARETLSQMADRKGWNSDERISVVTCPGPQPERSDRTPDRDDYPLLNGKEVMMEAWFRGGTGQALTDQPGRFEGMLGDVLHLIYKVKLAKKPGGVCHEEHPAAAGQRL